MSSTALPTFLSRARLITAVVSVILLLLLGILGAALALAVGVVALRREAGLPLLGILAVLLAGAAFWSPLSAASAALRLVIPGERAAYRPPSPPN